MLHSVRTGGSAFRELHGMVLWEYWAAHPEEAAVFDAAMTSLSPGVVDTLVGSYDFSGTRTLADIGGGQGELLARILAAYPALRGILFDHSDVVRSAGALLGEAKFGVHPFFQAVE